MTTLNDETRSVIDAVLEAIDIPYAATVGHDETRARILGQRIMALKVAFKLIADTGDRDADQLGRRLADLRESLADHPAEGYVTDQQAHERCEAGATWTEAVRLDYAAPARKAG